MATITLVENGPAIIKCTDELHVNGKPQGFNTPVALCRCGRSAKHPFCDGSHEGSIKLTPAEPK